MFRGVSNFEGKVVFELFSKFIEIRIEEVYIGILSTTSRTARVTLRAGDLYDFDTNLHIIKVDQIRIKYFTFFESSRFYLEKSMSIPRACLQNNIWNQRRARYEARHLFLRICSSGRYENVNAALRIGNFKPNLTVT